MQQSCKINLEWVPEAYKQPVPVVNKQGNVVNKANYAPGLHSLKKVKRVKR